MHSRQVFASVAAIAMLVGCGDKREMAADRIAYEIAPAAAPAPVPPGTANSYTGNQKLIRTGELLIEVADVPTALKSADSLVQTRKALVTESRMSRDADERMQAHLVLRIPADHFVETIGALKALGETRNESVGTSDVTKEYADLETRLAVKEQTLKRLRELLANRTGKLADVLEVEKELAETIAQLEQMKGERIYYDQQVALSTLTLTLVDRATSRSSHLVQPIREAFRSAVEVFGKSVAMLIYLVTFLLPWLLVASGVWWVARRLGWRYRKPSQ